MSSRRVQGFTLIELLVVMAVLAILVGLVLSAVQKAREMARLAVCSNHLKQIGIGLHSYQAVMNVFPLGMTKAPFGGPKDYRGWNGWSAVSQMLPQLDLPVLYNSINFSWNPDQAGPRHTGLGALFNSTVVNTSVELFMCPSDPYQGSGRNCSYSASLGTTTLSNPKTTTGLFAKYTSYGQHDCQDGLSNTIAFSEALVGKAGGGNGYRGNVVIAVPDTSPTIQMLDASTNPAVVDRAKANCMAAFRAGTNIRDDRGAHWAAGRVGYTLFHTVSTPNDSQMLLNGCRLGGKPFYSSNSQNITPASSQHTGAVNVLMGDGAIRQVKNGITPAVWWSLGTKAGGEPLSSE